MEETGLRAEDVKVDWSTPSCVDACKYAFFQGQLGERQPTPTKELIKFKEISVSASHADFGFRLQQVLFKLSATNRRRAKPTDLANFGDQPPELSAPPGGTATALPSGIPPTKRKCEHGSVHEAERGSGDVVAGPSNLRDVLCDLQYKVDDAALKAHANAPEAGTTWASRDENEARSKMTERDYIRLFLNGKRMKRMSDGSGVCTFS